MIQSIAHYMHKNYQILDEKENDEKVVSPLKPKRLSVDHALQFEQIENTFQNDYQKLTSKRKIKDLINHSDISDSVQEVTIKKILFALDSQDWSNPIFDDPNLYAYCSVKAVEKGALKVEQFCTLMFYYSLTNHHNKTEIESVPLFLNGKTINPKAQELIEETLTHSKFSFTATHINLFFEKMKKYPLSDQQLFIVPDKQPIEAENDRFNRLRTITQESYKVGFTIFNKLASQKRMMPSFGMMQTYLDVKFDKPVKITPIIGISSFKDIENNGLTRTRDMAIPYPGLEFPTEADLFQATLTYDFIYHDFYHSSVNSNIPQDHVAAAIQLGREVLALKDKEELKQVENIIKAFYERIIDLEYMPYMETNSTKIHYTYFWGAIAHCFSYSIGRLLRVQFYQTGEKKMIFHRKELTPFFKNLAQVLESLKEDFAKKYGLKVKIKPSLTENPSTECLFLESLSRALKDSRDGYFHMPCKSSLKITI